MFHGIYYAVNKFACLNALKIYIKEIPNGFRVWMAWSKHTGMLRELRRTEKSRAAGECFPSFSQLEQHPKCLDQAIQTRKPFSN